MPPHLKTEGTNFSGSVIEESFAEFMDPPPQDQAIPEAASINRDDKLLSFRLPTYNFTLLDYSLRRTSLSLQAQLHGMFFMAEPSNDSIIDPTTNAELTCYRRNLFQVTGSITVPRTMRYIMTDQGDRIPIIGQELTISATESVEGHPVKLISVPWKTPASNTGTTPEDKSEKEPTSIQLDTMSNQDMDADYATFPIAWKRLQFRIATANNGRRKELQQHFVVRLKVVATLSSGARVSICEATSGAIIVRGRSPRNFQQRKDMPVGRDSGGSRKASSHPTSLKRNTSDDSQNTVTNTGAERQSPVDVTTRFNFNIDGATPPDHNSIPSNPSKNAPLSSLPAPTTTRSDHRSTPSPSKSPPNFSHSIGNSERLSFVENPQPSPHKAKFSRTTSATSSDAVISPFKRPSMPRSVSNNSQEPCLQRSTSDLDPADLLYEYFPLGLDDWQPPVDAVYRPHVVHHIANAPIPLASGAVMAGGRSKRYFSEDFG